MAIVNPRRLPQADPPLVPNQYIGHLCNVRYISKICRVHVYLMIKRTSVSLSVIT